MKQEFGRTLDTWWGFFPDSMCAEVQRKTLGAGSVDAGRRRTLFAGEEEPEDIMSEEASYRSGDGLGRHPKRPMAHHAPPPGARAGALPTEHFHPRGGPSAPSFPPQPPPILRLLHDLRSAVTVPPELYNEKLVAELMYHVCHR